MCIFAPRFIFIVLTTWLTPYRFYASASSLFISEEIKSRTDDKQPLSESVFYIRQPTLLKLWANMMCRKIPATETTPRAIQHAAFQDISYPLTRSQRDRI
jgi:hypothetical protein